MNKPNDSVSVSGQATLPPAAKRFLKWGIIAWSTIGVLVLGGVLLWSLLQVTEVFPPLVVALITVYLLNPVVTRLEGFGVRRIFGSCMTYLLLLAVVAIVVALLMPALIDQAQGFAQDFPQTYERISDFIGRVTRQIESRVGSGVNLGEWLGSRTELVGGAVESVGGFLQGAAQTMALVVIGLVVGFYLLVDLPHLRRAALRLVPPDRRDEASKVASAVGTAMGGFFRGQLVVALIVGVMSSLGLLIIGLPHWLVVGFIAGFFNLIPLVGPFVGAIPAIIIALTLKPPITALWVIVVMTVVQQIDNHFISPNVMRLTVRLHPVTVMISLIAGATLAGFWGMLLAVPLVASVKVITSHLWRTRVPWGEEVFQEGDKMETLGPGEAAPKVEELADPGAPRPAGEPAEETARVPDRPIASE